MKIYVKTEAVALLITLVFSLIALHSRAACNLADGSQVTVEITVPVIQPKKLTMSAPDEDLIRLTAADSGDNNSLLTWGCAPYDSIPSMISEDTGRYLQINSPSDWPAVDALIWGLSVMTLYYDDLIATSGDPECFSRSSLKLYYDRDANIAGSPAWFHYWSQVVPWNRIETLSGGNGSYSGTTWHPDNITTVHLSADNDIHDFARLLAHENHHIVIYEDFWGHGGWGLDVFPDPDTDGDLYPDEWESTNPIAIAYGFDPDDGGDAYFQGSNSVGTNYEEDACNAVANALDVSQFDSSDWSKDGKQWE